MLLLLLLLLMMMMGAEHTGSALDPTLATLVPYLNLRDRGVGS
jgi:hypothetical protein